jgi:SPOR domain
MESDLAAIQAEEASAVESANSAESEKRRRKLFLTMILTVCSGLLLGIVYLGGRISATHAASVPVAPVRAASTTVLPPVAPAPAKPVAAAIQPAAPAPAKPVAAAIQPSAVVAKPAVATTVPQAVAVQVSPIKAVGEPTVQKTVVAPAAAASVTPPVITGGLQVPTEAPTRFFHGELVHPKPGDAYLQVGAMGSPYAERWVGVLEQHGYHPLVAEGPNNEIYRVLLGPFGAAEVQDVETKLRQAGIEHFEKVY